MGWKGAVASPDMAGLGHQGADIEPCGLENGVLLTQEPALLFNPTMPATLVIILPLFCLQFLLKFWYQ